MKTQNVDLMLIKTWLDTKNRAEQSTNYTLFSQKCLTICCVQPQKPL